MKVKALFECGIILLMTVGCTKNGTILNTQETDSFTDSHDGKVYQTIKIGNQWITLKIIFFHGVNMQKSCPIVQQYLKIKPSIIKEFNMISEEIKILKAKEVK